MGTLINNANYPALAKDKATQVSLRDSEAEPVKNPPKDLQKIRDIGPIGTTSHVLGTLIGIYPGFGLGHAVQGRWGYDGKIYTGLGFLLFFFLAPATSLVSCSERNETIKETEAQRSARCHSFLIGTGLILAIKGSEVYSLIMDPYEINSKYDKYKKQNLISLGTPQLKFSLFDHPVAVTSPDKTSRTGLGLTLSWSTF